MYALTGGVASGVGGGVTLGGHAQASIVGLRTVAYRLLTTICPWFNIMAMIRMIKALLLVLSAVPPLSSAATGLFMSAAVANASDAAMGQYLRTAAMACTAPWNISTSPQHVASVAIQSVGDGGDVGAGVGVGAGALYAAALDRMLPALHCVPTLYVGTTIPRGLDFYCGDVLNATCVRRAPHRAARTATCALPSRHAFALARAQGTVERG